MGIDRLVRRGVLVRSAGAGLVIAAALTLAGCGSGDDAGTAAPGPAVTGVTPTSTAVEEQSGPTESPSSMRTDGDLTLEDAATRIGAAQKKAGTFTYQGTISAGGMDLTATGSMDTSGDTIRFAQSAQGAGMTIQMRIVDARTGYVDLGSGWQSVDLTDTSDPLSAQLAQNLHQGDPAATTAAMTSLEKVGGPTELDGVSVQQYRGTLDVATALGGDVPEGTPAQAAVDLWVSAQDLPYRTVTDMGSAGRIDMTYANWGEPVAIEAP